MIVTQTQCRHLVAPHDSVIIYLNIMLDYGSLYYHCMKVFLLTITTEM